MNVPHDEVYGTYVRQLPYGSEKLVVAKDGTFEQRVSINGNTPVTVHGTWRFDPSTSRSRIEMQGSLSVDNGLGKLDPDWRVVGRGLVSESVERLWFRILIGSGSDYPYVKQ